MHSSPSPNDELETLKKLRVKITDELRELASEKKRSRDAVHNHPLSAKGLTVVTQQVKRVRIQSRIKDETDRAVEQTNSRSEATGAAHEWASRGVVVTRAVRNDP